MALISRIFTFLAFVAGAAAIAAAFLKIKPEIQRLETGWTATKGELSTMTSDRDKEKKAKEEVQGNLASTKKKLDETTSEADKLKKELDTANNRVRETQAQVDKVSSEITGLKSEIEKYKSSLPGDMTIEQLLAKLKSNEDTLATLEQEKKVLNEQMIKLDQEKKKAEELVRMKKEGKVPSGLTGHVLAVNDDWNFVVIDLGLNNAVVEGATAIVYRDGNLVAKIRISSVEPSIAIGDIIPEWKRGPLAEGDLVTF